MRSDVKQRWLAGLELLLFQAFPVQGIDGKDLTPTGAPVCSFNIPSGRSRSEIVAQAGNSMNVHCVGLALAFAVGMCAERSEQAHGADNLATFMRAAKKLKTGHGQRAQLACTRTQAAPCTWAL